MGFLLTLFPVFHIDSENNIHLLRTCRPLSLNEILNFFFLIVFLKTSSGAHVNNTNISDILQKLFCSDEQIQNGSTWK